jgi:hypothetical protein
VATALPRGFGAEVCKALSRRLQRLLEQGLSEEFDALAARPGATKTAILTDALSAWLERKTAHELDARFGPRLDRQSRSAQRIERKVDALTELVGVFVQYQMTLTAHQSAFDEETAQLGRSRYNHVLDLVEQRLAHGGTAARLAAPSEQAGDPL